MGPMKRPAAASGAIAKKGRTADPNLEKYHQIAAAVQAAGGFPGEMLKMVASTVKVGLQKPKDVRHAYAEQCLGMVEEVLKAAEAGVRDKVAGLESKVAASDEEKAAREAAVAAAGGEVKQKTEVLEASKAKLSAANDESAKAKATLQAAETEQKAGDEAFVAAADRKAKLEAVFGGDYALIKETTDAKLLKSFLRGSKGFGFDAQLMSAAESTFAKPAGERGMFDNLVTKELDIAFSAAVAAAEELLSQGEPPKAERAAKVEAAGVEAGAKAEAEAAVKEEFVAAQKALGEATAQRKGAEKAAKDFGPELAAAKKELTAANKELMECEATLATFDELRERTTPPPPPPAPEPEPEAPPADAEEEAAPEDAAMAPAAGEAEAAAAQPVA